MSSASETLLVGLVYGRQICKARMSSPSDGFGAVTSKNLVVALLAAALLLAGVGAGQAVVRIGGDPGGRIESYVEKYQAVLSSGQTVIVDGFCASACTIVLGVVPRDRICVTSRARFGFHSAWDSGSNGRRITNSQATQTLYSMYPYEIQRWIDRRGGLTPHMIVLSGRELTNMYRPCHLGSRAYSR